MRFKKGDNVLVFDDDVQSWRIGLILKVREHKDSDMGTWLNLYPIVIPDDGEWCYYIQYIDPSQREEDDIDGIYLEVGYAHENELIMPDTPLARAIYLGD